MLIQSEQDDAETLAAEDAAIAAAERPAAPPEDVPGGSIAQLIEALANGNETPVPHG